MAGDMEQRRSVITLLKPQGALSPPDEPRSTHPPARATKRGHVTLLILLIGKRSAAYRTFGNLSQTPLTHMMTARRQMKAVSGSEVKANGTRVAFVETGSHFKQLVGNVVRHPLGVGCWTL